MTTAAATATKRSKTDDETTASSLPPETLELIFSKLDQKYLQPVSLVSKSFLSSVRSSLTKLHIKKYVPNSPELPEIFDRFPYVEEITLSCHPSRHVLVAISDSKLNLKTLRLLRCPKSRYIFHLSTPSRITSTLRCLQINWHVSDEFSNSNFGWASITGFIQLFPSLTELELSYSGYWDDRLIQRIGSKLKNLRRLDLHGSKYVTDDILAAISSNCVYLEHLDVRHCYRMTPGGIGALIRSCEHLHSLYLPELVIDDSSEASIEQKCADPKLVELMEVISSSENLKHVSFGWAFLASDVILRTYAKSRPPLSTLTIHRDSKTTEDTNFSMAGVSELINACRGRLVQLDLELPRSDQLDTQDREMSLLVARLPHLEYIKIVGWASSLEETLESLKSNCPLLKTALLYWNAADGGKIKLKMLRQGDNSFSIKQKCRKSWWA